MANPNDAVGTNGAFGGRTSVNAFNDVLSAFSGRGIVSGWGCAPSSGLTVQLGGNGADRDVAIAEDASGNKTTINNISQTPVQVTVNPAPASNSRIDAIVAYIEDSPQGSGVTDNPDVVNLLVVSGTVASNPIAPNDNTIRTAITADGASGSTAYYVVLAQVTITTGTTDIDATMISAGTKATLTTPLSTGLVKANMIDFQTLGNYVHSASGDDVALADGVAQTVTWFNAPSTGEYLLLGQADVDAVSVSDYSYFSYSLLVSESRIAEVLSPIGVNNRVSMVVFGSASVTAGQRVSLVIEAYGTTGTARTSRCKIAMIRIG